MTAVLVAGSCTYDDTALQDRVGALEEKVTALEQTVNQMNTNLKALQETVNVLTAGDYIKEVTEVLAGDEVIGYTITFGKHSPVTIYNGEDGKNGSTPAISVVVGADGKYYWTVNGEILKDSTGKDVCATGMAPLLRINNGVWQYSVDNGANWSDIVVNGYAGVIFKTVTVGEDSVSIELADGQVFEIPKMSDFDLKFSSLSYYVENNAVYSVDYTIDGADNQTVVIAFPSGDVAAVVEKKTDASGSLKVTKGEQTSSVQVMVVSSNGKGQKDYEVLNFNEIEFSATSVDLAFATEGGAASVDITSNVTYTIEIVADGQWLTYELKDSETEGAKTLTFVATANELRRVRTASVNVVDQYGYLIQTIVVAQAAADYQSGGQMGDIPVMPA